MNICLIGARGVGKTRTARRLGILLHRPVVSTDVLVSYECGGKSVAQIIRQKGGGAVAWRFFREKEFEILKKIAHLKEVIVDCGGGIVVDIDKKGGERGSSRKIRLIRKNAVVVWLKGDPEKNADKDSRRPALSTSQSPMEIMKRRKPFYARAAHATVRVDKLGAKTIAQRILKRVKLD